VNVKAGLQQDSVTKFSVIAMNWVTPKAAVQHEQTSQSVTKQVSV